MPDRSCVLNFAAFAWGVAEATLFFIVPDVLLSAIGVTRGAKVGAVAALWASLGAALGGALMFAWSAANPHAARDAVLAVPAINKAMAQAAADSVSAHGWFLATILGPLSTTPYKLFAIMAPRAGAPFLLFVLASVVARLPRFALLAAGPALIGRALAPRFGTRGVLWLLACAWVLFYAAYFWLHPS